jgi:alkanesulfonate monooxygenase SsuD/methylene tetrahydromethanopterin reductase-like flavin-dependent oxidoreductase (luciferase family)
MRLAAYISPGGDLAAGVSLARLAEGLEYESVWVTHGLGRDSFLVLAAYAAATTRLGLGNGVVPVYPRHPVAMAQAALTLAEVSGGRFRLGIGVSHRASMEAMLGLAVLEPLSVMREYVAVLRGALGGKVAHQGARYRVAWQSGLSRLPPAPPVLLAGLGPQMLELAGEIADGAVLWLCAPAYIRDVALPAIRRGRQRAGRPLDGFEVVAAVPAALTGDRAAGSALFKAELTRYLALPFYRAMLAQSGFRAELEQYDRTPRPEAVPDRLVAGLAAVGDVASLAAFLAAHRAAGVTLPAVRPIGFPDAPHYAPTVEAAITA